MIKRGLPLGESALIPLDDVLAFLERQFKTTCRISYPTEAASSLLEAIIEGYLSDAWQSSISRWNMVYELQDRKIRELVTMASSMLAKTIESSCGPLVPSYRYRFQLEDTTLRLSAFLPDTPTDPITRELPDDALPYSWCHT
jgi:hypothetical protein